MFDYPVSLSVSPPLVAAAPVPTGVSAASIQSGGAMGVVPVSSGAGCECGAAPGFLGMPGVDVMQWSTWPASFKIGAAIIGVAAVYKIARAM